LCFRYKVLERRIRCKLIIGCKESHDLKNGDEKTNQTNGQVVQGKNFNGGQKSSDQLTVDADTLIGRDPANGEQDTEPRDQKTEPFIGGELAEDVAALEDALELSSLSPEKRTSILADIKKLMAEAALGRGGGHSVASESPWLQLPHFKAGKLPCFRNRSKLTYMYICNYITITCETANKKTYDTAYSA
jgi:hypothetical protein